MRARAIATAVTATLVAVGGVAAHDATAVAARPAATIACADTSVRPGVGVVLVTRLRATALGCTRARGVVRAFEHRFNGDPNGSVVVRGRRYRCVRTRFGPGEGEIRSRVVCRSGARRVTWHANYGI